MKALLALVLALIVGCDNPAVLANIDTYTCAYLPGVVDCTTPEVHDKAVAMLQHGIVEADIVCQCLLTSPLTNITPGPYHLQRLIDGACFATPPFIVPSQLIPRSDPSAPTCKTASGSASIELDDGVIIFHNGAHPDDTFTGSATTSCCTGFNLEAFGVE